MTWFSRAAPRAAAREGVKPPSRAEEVARAVPSAGSVRGVCVWRGEEAAGERGRRDAPAFSRRGPYHAGGGQGAQRGRSERRDWSAPRSRELQRERPLRGR